MFIRELFDCIGSPITTATPMYEDSSSALAWIRKGPRWKASRHISARHFKCNQWARQGHIIPHKVATADQLADIATKSLPEDDFIRIRSRILSS